MNNKLLEKIKLIKNLEKDLKEKNTNIEKMQIKIDKQRDEIKKITEKLNVKNKYLKS